MDAKLIEAVSDAIDAHQHRDDSTTPDILAEAALLALGAYLRTLTPHEFGQAIKEIVRALSME